MARMPCAMFRFFETLTHPTTPPAASPPPGLLAFYWHFVRQTRGLYAAMLATGLVVAFIDTRTAEGGDIGPARELKRFHVQRR